jgi:N-acetylmuramoyl-L-alanine amidase
MRRLGALASAVLFWSCSTAAPQEGMAPVAVAARLTQDTHRAELSFDVSRAVKAQVYALTSPYRLVVDLPEVTFRLPPSFGRVANENAAPLVKAVRFGVYGSRDSRVVVDLERSACPDHIESKAIAEGMPASRLTIDITPCEKTAFAAIAHPAEEATRNPNVPASPAEPVIVIDPGHGGSDGGAHGVGGVLEKTLVLQFCLGLKHQLEATKRYRIVMTRDGDRYVDLEDRVTIAREANASLFISVHADTLNEAPEVGGATVYTVADHASDAEAARIAARENATDRLGRAERRGQQDPGVADILFDLERRETRLYAHVFSHDLVNGLRAETRLNRNPERGAGFVVLKAPEFPSVLVELGYVSNAQDVQALSSPEWRKKTASAMVGAINAFFDLPAGTAASAATNSGVVR